MSRLNLAFCACLFFVLYGCGDEPSSPVTSGSDVGLTDMGSEPIAKPEIRFILSEPITATSIGEIPFPNNIYLNESGTIQIDTFAFNLNGSLIDKLLSTLNEHVRGFACAGTHYMSFDAPIDPSRLPSTGAASLEAESTLFLVDIDPSSPKNGERYPVRWRFQSEETLYLPPNTLAIRPVEGLALRPATTYAMVLLKDVANTNMTFQSMLASEEPGSNRETWSVYAPLRDSSLQLDQIATASVFTTMDPVSEMFELANFINEYQPPEVKSLERRGSFPGLYVEYEGYMKRRTSKVDHLLFLLRAVILNTERTATQLFNGLSDCVFQ